MTIRLFTKTATLTLLGAVLLTVGCSSTPRGLAHKANRPIADAPLIVQSLEVQTFAREVSALSVGERAFFASSPLGYNLEVTARPFYDNALGEHCRTAQASLGLGSKVFAVCQQSDGSWRYVAPLTDGTEAQ